MDATTILEIRPALHRFLQQFAGCFGRSSTRRYLPVYIRGQLSDLPRQSIEPIADAAGIPSRNLQEFLSLFRWDECRLRGQLHQHVARHHSSADSVAVIDETSFVKKGDQTACVQRQYCGAVGKVDEVRNEGVHSQTPGQRGAGSRSRLRQAFQPVLSQHCKIKGIHHAIAAKGGNIGG